MKTNTLIHTLAALLAIGTASSAIASPSRARNTAAGASIASDKPVVTILFQHTADNPYDIRLLSWCGGAASRVQIIPKTDKTLIIAYNTGDLHGAKITGAAPTTVGFRVCKNGKPTILFDLISLEKKETLLPNLVTRLSSIPEWKIAIDLQNRGQLDVKTFAHAALAGDHRDQYAYNSAPVQPRL
jgi:hypothetical protein